MIKIAFHTLGNETWHAGTIYLFYLLKALRHFTGDEVSLSLLLSDIGDQAPEDLLKLVDESLAYPDCGRWTLPWFASRASARLFGRDVWADRFFRKRGVHIIAFGRAPQGSRIPLFAWIPDFQHIHMPEMFSPGEVAMRNELFPRLAEDSSRIILLSETVKRDLKSFLPKHADKARVVSPASYIPGTVYEREPRSVCNIYTLPEKFIYLPNQFWKHKDHSTAFRAVKILKDQGLRIFIVCSGPVNDYRHPNHFSSLLQQASHLGIRNQIAFLGVLPREHVYMMIRQSACVMNPSLFEGFGMVVDEARSVGKRLLLSDIEAHREQLPPQAVFFSPGDEQDLALKMKLIWEEQSPGPDLKLEVEAQRIMPRRLKAFGKSFMAVACELVP